MLLIKIKDVFNSGPNQECFSGMLASSNGSSVIQRLFFETFFLKVMRVYSEEFLDAEYQKVIEQDVVKEREWKQDAIPKPKNRKAGRMFEQNSNRSKPPKCNKKKRASLSKAKPRDWPKRTLKSRFSKMHQEKKVLTFETKIDYDETLLGTDPPNNQVASPVNHLAQVQEISSKLSHNIDCHLSWSDSILEDEYRNAISDQILYCPSRDEYVEEHSSVEEIEGQIEMISLAEMEIDTIDEEYVHRIKSLNIAEGAITDEASAKSIHSSSIVEGSKTVVECTKYINSSSIVEGATTDEECTKIIDSSSIVEGNKAIDECTKYSNSFSKVEEGITDTTECAMSIQLSSIIEGDKTVVECTKYLNLSGKIECLQELEPNFSRNRNAAATVIQCLFRGFQLHRGIRSNKNLLMLRNIRISGICKELADQVRRTYISFTVSIEGGGLFLSCANLTFQMLLEWKSQDLVSESGSILLKVVGFASNKTSQLLFQHYWSGIVDSSEQIQYRGLMDVGPFKQHRSVDRPELLCEVDTASVACGWSWLSLDSEDISKWRIQKTDEINVIPIKASWVARGLSCFKRKKSEEQLHGNQVLKSCEWEGTKDSRVRIWIAVTKSGLYVFPNSNMGEPILIFKSNRIVANYGIKSSFELRAEGNTSLCHRFDTKLMQSPLLIESALFEMDSLSVTLSCVRALGRIEQ